MSIGANIKKRRFELRMSQQELADVMGYKTRSTIAKIEAGENDVSHKKLLKFAAALDTTPEALLTGFSGITVNDGQILSGRTGKTVVVILAGGNTGRNRQSIPSQFMNVHGRPIIVHCMDAYQAHPMVDDIFIVCGRKWSSILQAYSSQYGITKVRELIPAGNTGMESLKNALLHLCELYAPEDTVIIQEATRPLVREETISRVLQACAEKGSATICHSMNEYVQFNISDAQPEYIDRNSVIALQSPEAHRLSLLEEVFHQAALLKHPLTESCCTMLLYNLGYDINFIESSINNIKISREEDIAAFGILAKL